MGVEENKMRKKTMLGVMQGRFTHKGGFYPQDFPKDNWENEFYIAQAQRLDCLEWMFNSECFQENPIWTECGQKRIQEVIASSGVTISSVCANYFMKKGICDTGSIEVMKRLIDACNILGIRQVILPLFEASAEITTVQISEVLFEIGELVSRSKIRICIESDLPAIQQKRLCDLAEGDKTGICYDLGNAAGNGCDYVSDILAIGDRLFELHIKDKQPGGSSVMLGSGSVELERVFHVLNPERETIFILESYFGSDAEEDTIKNIQYVKKRMKEQGVWQ